RSNVEFPYSERTPWHRSPCAPHGVGRLGLRRVRCPLNPDTRGDRRPSDLCSSDRHSGYIRTRDRHPCDFHHTADTGRRAGDPSPYSHSRSHLDSRTDAGQHSQADSLRYSGANAHSHACAGTHLYPCADFYPRAASHRAPSHRYASADADASAHSNSNARAGADADPRSTAVDL
ncbi:MAG: hypothetical protein J4N86_09670, partial [Chloroflexi bacterium]|nr:hypothetical protein [Chloroflexota bacterium]